MNGFAFGQYVVTASLGDLPFVWSVNFSTAFFISWIQQRPIQNQCFLPMNTCQAEMLLHSKSTALHSLYDFNESMEIL